MWLAHRIKPGKSVNNSRPSFHLPSFHLSTMPMCGLTSLQAAEADKAAAVAAAEADKAAAVAAAVTAAEALAVDLPKLRGTDPVASLDLS